jgi:hypothetical protein
MTTMCRWRIVESDAHQCRFSYLPAPANVDAALEELTYARVSLDA